MMGDAEGYLMRKPLPHDGVGQPGNGKLIKALILD
jgi:hypothetical protein